MYPNEQQKELFAKTFGCARAIYNMMLHDKIEHYKETGKMLRNTPAQYKGEHEWLKEVDCYALCNAQLSLEKAYKNFFRDKSVGFPKFKSKKNARRSYTTNNSGGSIRIEGNSIRLAKVGMVKIVQHRPIPDTHKIKSCTISLTPSGAYYISILTEYEGEKPTPVLDKSKALGLDYSSPRFYVDSQGNEAGYPMFYRQGEERLAIEQRKLSKMVPGSQNYKKQKIRVAKVHERLSNQRKDWSHKRSTALADAWDYICVEDINLRGMAGSLKLGKATNDNGFGAFREYLAYKMDERGKQFIKIGKWFPSSKACNECGQINKSLTLGDREWTCDCGAHHDRDTNAAINIRDCGLQLATK